MNQRGSEHPSIHQDHGIHDLAAVQTAKSVEIDAAHIILKVIKRLNDHQAAAP
jgi:hypothetical protein